MRRRSWLTLAVSGFTLVAASACGGSQYPQGPVPQPPSSPMDDPPGRVGRLSYIEGPVSFLPAGADSWAAAEPNRPVTTGDGLWADNDARAEIDIGSTVLRLAGQTEVDVLRLDDRWLQVRVPQGTLSQRVGVLARDQDAEIDTPNAAITLTQAGSYRVSVSPDGLTTTVTVWSGEAEVTAAGSTFPVQRRQVATIQGDEQLTYDLYDAGAPDDFDRWALERDARADQASAARRYVSEDMPGVDDLDPYGRWDTDAGYGPIWYPTTVEIGWAPYRHGHWVWVGRWGWTWVDDAPWGFAPYHYGRWANVRGRWGWCPGRTIREPVYAPALVVFIGGSGWSASAAFGPRGGVGWFPLAPDEVYYPAYAHDPDYRQRINITNVTNVTIINNVTNVTNVKYRNRDVRGAVTAVPEQAFITAQPVRRAVVDLPSRDLASARVMGAAPFAPTTASLVGGVPGRRAPPPAALATRPAVATHAPPPAPVPFTLQQRELKDNGGRPLTPEQLARLRPAAPAAGPAAAPVRSAVSPGPGALPLKPARRGLPVTPKPADKVFAPEPPSPAAQPARPQPGQPPITPEPGQRPDKKAPPAAPSPAAQPARPQPGQPPITPEPGQRPDKKARPEAQQPAAKAPPAAQRPAGKAPPKGQKPGPKAPPKRQQPAGKAPPDSLKPAEKAPPDSQKPAEKAPPNSQTPEGEEQ